MIMSDRSGIVDSRIGALKLKLSILKTKKSTVYEKYKKIKSLFIY